MSPALDTASSAHSAATMEVWLLCALSCFSLQKAGGGDPANDRWGRGSGIPRRRQPWELWCQRALRAQAELVTLGPRHAVSAAGCFFAAVPLASCAMIVEQVTVGT